MKVITITTLKDWEPLFTALKAGQLERRFQDGWEKADHISVQDEDYE